MTQTLEQWLASVKERLENATRGLWKVQETSGIMLNVESNIPSKVRDFTVICCKDKTTKPHDNFDFIAHSKEDITRLLRLVEVRGEALYKVASNLEDYATEIGKESDKGVKIADDALAFDGTDKGDGDGK